MFDDDLIKLINFWIHLVQCPINKSCECQNIPSIDAESLHNNPIYSGGNVTEYVQDGLASIGSFSKSFIESLCKGKVLNIN